MICHGISPLSIKNALGALLYLHRCHDLLVFESLAQGMTTDIPMNISMFKFIMIFKITM